MTRSGAAARVAWCAMRNKGFPVAAFGNQPLPPNWLQGGFAPAPVEGLRIASRPATSSGENSAVECLDWQEARRHEKAWQDLARNAMESNVFLLPAFVLTAVHHGAAAQRPHFIFVWRDAVSRNSDALLGVFVVNIPKFGTGTIARLWTSPITALGTPLVRPGEGVQTVDRLLKWLAARHPHIHGLSLPQMALDGPVARLFLQDARTHGLGTRVFDRRSRAIVTSELSASDFLSSFASAKKQKELRRQRRRLAECGKLTYSSARTSEQIREAMERFLLLEASGWKGDQSTALLSDASTSTFARAMTRLFAQEQSCWIDALELDGVPIAMGIVLVAGDTAFYWKTAYDERFARYSPGVLFSIEMTTRAMAQGKHALINSCAVPNHPMIDHIWRERIELGDILVQMRGVSQTAFAVSASTQGVLRRMRASAKSIYHALRTRGAA